MVTTTGVLAAYALLVVLPTIHFSAKPGLLLGTLPHQIHYVSQPWWRPITSWRPTTRSPRSTTLVTYWSPERRRWESFKLNLSCRSFLVFTLSIFGILLIILLDWCHVWGGWRWPPSPAPLPSPPWSPSPSPSAWWPPIEEEVPKIHDFNLCYLAIKSDTGQYSQFLWCFDVFSPILYVYHRNKELTPLQGPNWFEWSPRAWKLSTRWHPAHPPHGLLRDQCKCGKACSSAQTRLQPPSPAYVFLLSTNSSLMDLKKKNKTSKAVLQ